LTDLFNGRAKAVFFDLDGTLVDTAPDMVAALQDLQRSHGIAPVPYALGRSHVSNGALGLLLLAFPDHAVESNGKLICEYVDRYAARVCEKSRVFAGLDALLDQFDAGSMPWGVVTNKPAHLTTPIMLALGLADRSACTVSGDTLPTRKPDPAPLLHACRIAGVAAADCIFVGDAARDIEAGSRAGMATVAATYGYVVSSDDPHAWGADAYANNTAELSQILLKAVNLPAR
jgi:N-acetyl-D-muramate 6-phosphate phosphatase